MTVSHRWAEMRLWTPRLWSEAVGNVLETIGCPGVAFIDSNAASSDPWAMEAEPAARGGPEDAIEVVGHLPVDDRLEASLSDLRRRLDQLVESGLPQAPAIRLTWRDEEDWADGWKQHFHAARVGERLVICPSWEQWEGEPGDLVLQLDPGMAFGTGLHATTRMCLEALERLVRPEDRVLDWGVGSGILSLAAARLGAGSVLGLDLDPVAVRVARENVERNRLAGVIAIQEGGVDSLDPADRFDGLLANILAQPIIDNAANLARCLQPGAWAVFSGVIDSQQPNVEAALERAGFSLLEVRRTDEWRAFITRRGQPAPQ